jgi:hypothetical protein
VPKEAVVPAPPETDGLILGPDVAPEPIHLSLTD